jgi:hypothetical protein
MKTNDDPLARRALFVAYEGMGGGTASVRFTDLERPAIGPRSVCSGVNSGPGATARGPRSSAANLPSSARIAFSEPVPDLL